MAEALEFPIKWGMVVDLDKCTGCGACMVACQAENNLAPEADAGNKLRSLNWLVVYRLSNGKPYPEHETAYLPRPCMQCGKPSCVSVCPVIATDKRENGGIVSQIPPRCIGCRYCMASCPYHARYFNWHDPQWPGDLARVLTPDVSTRPRGVVEKCSFCHHRWMKAKDMAVSQGQNPADLPEEAYQTSCAETCPNGAITFGDLKNPVHRVHQLAQSPHAFRLLERLGTDPQVYYLSRRDWIRRQGDNHLESETSGVRGG
jgi:molybdopterin-containing oxidoreductase family iron-sulfur binding subunit